MMSENEVAGSSLPAQLLHHVTRRRNRFYGAVAVALLLFSVAIWVYGGFDRGVDFITSLPRPPPQSPPQHPHQQPPPPPPPPPPAVSPSSAKDLAGSSTSISVSSTHGSHPTQTSPVAQSTSSDDLRHSNQSPAANVSHGIPPKIWQILLPKKPSDQKIIPKPEVLEETPSWLVMNTDYAYTVVSQDGGDEIVQQYFSDDPRILDAYVKMPNVGMKSDLLRYLILEAIGGVYSDTDTVALKPIDDWVPAHLRDKVSVVVGLEFDRRDGPAWADILHPVQFCQWTIAAAPGHPVFRKMVERILTKLDELSAEHGLPIEQLKPSSVEVMNSTGPAAWSEVVFHQLQEFDSSLTDFRNLSYMTEPKLIGDMLVLTIDGFGMGQPHSNSTNDGSIPAAALVKHLFKGSWRGNNKRSGEVEST